MDNLDSMTRLMPQAMRKRVEPLLEVLGMLGEVKNTSAMAAMVPSVVRGFILRQGRNQPHSKMVSGHSAYFDWGYKSDFPEMQDLYQRAKLGQWNAETVLDWSTDVDPMNPAVPLLPEGFLPFHLIEGRIKFTEKESREFLYSVCAWMLSQFLHGEQGALYAAAQVTESVQWMDGKLYGATQVMDEGRHVEVFNRYIDKKLNKMYVINDNLFTIIDALMTDSRWDMKFLGMQIMVEGLALGAFGTLYRLTREPLLRELLRYVIQDEARHVHYGVLALKEHFTKNLSDAERREREDWAFEVALLMRNRFMAHEVYEEWLEGTISRKEWNHFVTEAPGMREFRQVMFNRLMPNLKEIGLLSDRVLRHYEEAGLLQYASGKSALNLTGDSMLQELDNGPSEFEGYLAGHAPSNVTRLDDHRAARSDRTRAAG